MYGFVQDKVILSINGMEECTLYHIKLLYEHLENEGVLMVRHFQGRSDPGLRYHRAEQALLWMAGLKNTRETFVIDSALNKG